jgi:hypothetical protein
MTEIPDNFTKAIDGHNLTVSCVGSDLTLTFSLDECDSCATQVSANGNVTVSKVSRNLSQDIFDLTGIRVNFSAYRKAHAGELESLPQADAKPTKAKRSSLLTGLVG